MRWMISCMVPFCVAAAANADAIVEVRADPPQVRLAGAGASWSLLVHGVTATGKTIDLTHAARYQSTKPAVASVDMRGRILAVSDGDAAIQIEAAGRRLDVPVAVTGSRQPRQWHFETDIEPILGRFGCNSSGCHGKAEGQNGFKLSVFGFDAEADYAALLKEGRGRRIFAAAPQQSLLLRKASGQMAHGGGTRIRPGSDAYEALRNWIAAGAPFGDGNSPILVGIRIEPAERLLGMRATQQLRVLARFSDNRELDVTHRARFQSNNEGLALVGSTGLVTTLESPGEVAIMAGFLNEVAVFRGLIPHAEPLPPAPPLPQHNFIDKLVDQKLAKLNIRASELCNDSTFLRRVYLDLIGTLPTANEARRFLADSKPDKRSRLVADLLEQPEFADYWALKWADVLRVDRTALGHQHAYQYYRWIRDSIHVNKPLDQFARELITAEGALGENGPAAFYKIMKKPGETASSLSQALLGVRIACAECHHHPFDRWSQDDYFGMQAFFAQLSIKGKKQTESLVASGDPQTLHPRTGKKITAHALGQPMPAENPGGDRRIALAEWLTSPGNPYFARNLANRVWAHLFGRGLVEPVDDVRATNPPSNPELLDALAQHLIEAKFDLRRLLRTVVASRVYQASSLPNASNERDEQNASRALLRRVEAEVLLDMVGQVTGVPEKFPGVPAGSRAIQLWDSNVNHYFLKQFGRPERTSACECERNHEPNVAQVLHLLNSPQVNDKLAHEAGIVARLHHDIRDDAKIVDELYLIYFSRFPKTAEKQAAVAHLKRRAAKRRQAVEDLAWALLNSVEFRFNH